MGIEPTYPAWKAGVLPLNYTCISYNIGVTGFEPATSCSQSRRSSQAEPHPGLCKIKNFVLLTIPCLSQRQKLLYISSSQLSTLFLFFSKNFFRPLRGGKSEPEGMAIGGAAHRSFRRVTEAAALPRFAILWKG